jgi:hypothetical protein
MLSATSSCSLGQHTLEPTHCRLSKVVGGANFRHLIAACVLLLQHKPANEAYIAYAARETLEFAHSPIEDLSVPGERQ